ncbi:MAG: hypothetical protein ACW981_07275 [Candidatus Hodarchaeales archaeon]|jgi:hypothetical protein
MPDYDNTSLIIRITIVILAPLFIIIGTIALAESASFSSKTDILNVDIGDPSQFIMMFGFGFAFLVFFALLYGFIIRRNIHG